MSRPAMPPIPPSVAGLFHDLTADRRSLVGLGAAALAIAAAGLDPHVLDPGQRRILSLASDTSITSLLIAGAVVQAGLILLGGALADLWRSVRLVRAALLGLVLASAGAMVFNDIPGIIWFRIVAWTCDGIIIPFAVSMAAQLYAGEVRGIAIGMVLGAYGIAQFLAPILLGVLGPTSPEYVAFGLCIVVSVVAFFVVKGRLPMLPGALPGQRLAIATTALWAFGAIVAFNGIMNLEPLPVATGSVIVLVSLLVRRVLHAPREQGVKARAGGAALAAGLVIGFGQSIPLFALPLFFNLIQGVDKLVANIMIAPFVIGIVIAGPAAGYLLARFTPRRLILVGVWAIAIANLGFFVLLGRDTGYWELIVPFALIGMGFIVSTTIRTAIIFASTPRLLAGTAAALNEASLGIGTRMGLMLAVFATGGGLGANVLLSIRLSLIFAGAIGVIGGILIFFLLGSHDPVRTQWDLRDEREAKAP
jgi:MFS family permease